MRQQLNTILWENYHPQSRDTCDIIVEDLKLKRGTQKEKREYNQMYNIKAATEKHTQTHIKVQHDRDR